METEKAVNCETAAKYPRSDKQGGTAHCMHLRLIIEGFAVGTIQADPWHKNYSTLPGFQDVLDRLAVALRMSFDATEVVYLSLEELESFYRNFLALTDPARAWNDSVALRRLAGETVSEDEKSLELSFVSRFDPVPERRDFVDLDALVRNAVIYVTRHVERAEESGARFDRSWRLEERVRLLESLLLEIDETCRRLGEASYDRDTFCERARLLRYGAPDETDIMRNAYQSAQLAGLLAEIRAPKIYAEAVQAEAISENGQECSKQQPA